MAEQVKDREELRELMATVLDRKAFDGSESTRGVYWMRRREAAFEEVDAQLAALAEAGVAVVDLAKFDAGLQSGQLPNMRNDVRQIAFAETKAALRNARVDLAAERIDKP